MLLFLLLLPQLLSGKKHLQDSYPELSIYEVIRQTARNTTELRAIGAILQSNCTYIPQIRDAVANQTNSLTFFAPTDASFPRLFGTPIPFTKLYCQDDSNCTSSPIPPYGTPFDPRNAINCIGPALLYHVIPDIQVPLLDTLGSLPYAFSIYPTALPSSIFVTENQPLVVFQKQDFVNNQTTAYINPSGIFGAARVVQSNIQCRNGILHLIDLPLIPPANLTRTMEYLTKGTGLYYRSLLSYPPPTQRPLTLFIPLNQTFAPQSPAEVIRRSFPPFFNYTYYTIPDRLIYANETQLAANKPIKIQSETSMADTNLTIRYGLNYSMFVNDIPVVHPNILFENGVLHLVKNPIPAAIQNNTTDNSQ